MRTLKEMLKDWTDWDAAMFAIGVVLGLWEDGNDSFLKHKHIFWSRHDLDTHLSAILGELVDRGFVEEEEGPQFRWKQ